jgi:hypothetical protein
VAGVGSYQLPQNFDRLAMPVRLTNTPMKEYTPLDWPYYIPTVDPGGQGGPHSYMVKNQVLSVFPAPTSDTVTTNPQFVLAYYKHPGIRIPASAAGDAMTWDVPPEFVEPLDNLWEVETEALSGVSRQPSRHGALRAVDPAEHEQAPVCAPEPANAPAV